MFDTDFSRIGELFYKDASTQNEPVSVAGFIKTAFKKYDASYVRPGLIGPSKRFTFLGKDKRSFVSFDLMQGLRCPEVSACLLFAENVSFSAIIERLHGQLSADFTGIDPAEIEKVTGTRPQRKQDYANLGVLGLYFSPNPDADIVQRAVLEKTRFFSTPVPLILGETVLDIPTYALLSCANKITLNNQISFRDEKQPDTIDLLARQALRDRVQECLSRILLQEQSEIYHPQNGIYHWSHKIWVTNKEGMPYCVLPNLESLFAPIQDKFDENSFQNLVIQDDFGGTHG